MIRTVIEGSSNVKSVGFDPVNVVLEVEFIAKSDAPPAVYQYRELEGAEPCLARFHEMMLEPGASCGSIIAKFIRKNPELITTKLEPEPEVEA